MTFAVVIILAWLGVPLLRRRSVVVLSLCAGGLLVALFMVLRFRDELVMRRVTRSASIAQGLARMSLLSNLVNSPAPPAMWSVGCEGCVPTCASPESEAPSARTRNVVVLILESTRWDFWGDASTTSRFSDWKRRGSFVPRAATAFPATSVSYASLLTSKPAALVASEQDWTFDQGLHTLLRSFDHVVFSKPDSQYFRMPRLQAVTAAYGALWNTHADAQTALGFIRRQLLDGKGSTFAWAHLYEPHAPHTSATSSGADTEVERYRSEVAYVDEQVGDFVSWLMSDPRAESTMLIVTADHGESLGDLIDGNERWGHGFTVRGIETAVPLFLAGPGIPVDVELPPYSAALVDVLPTMLDFVGTALPAGAWRGRTGRSLLKPSPRGRVTISERWATSVVIGANPKHVEHAFAVHDGRFTMIADPEVSSVSLFDALMDPYEQRDLSGANPEAVARLRSALLAWIAERRGDLDAEIMRCERELQN